MAFDYPRQLSEEEEKIKKLWKRVIRHIRKDLANVWTDEIREDFAKIKIESGRIAFVFRKLHSHYKSNPDLYQKEADDVKNLINHLNKIDTKSEWVNQIHLDLSRIILDIEREIRGVKRVGFDYSPFKRSIKKIYRKFSPVPKSPWTMGDVQDICSVNLVPPEDLKIFFENCIRLLQRIKGNSIGDYLEFGVFNGSSMSSMHLTAKKLGLGSMRFFGFDAFQGLPKGAENEDNGVWKTGFYACSFEKMQECLQRKNIDPNDINWVIGWYDNTLNRETIKKFAINKIGIVFIDCDTYSSSKKVLDFIGPLLKEPAILCFDDWKLNDLDIKGMGEYKAFNEFLEKNRHLQATSIKSYNRKSRSFLIKSPL